VISKCQISYDDPCLLQIEEPAGEYEIQLADPYQRAIAKVYATTAELDGRGLEKGPLRHVTLNGSSFCLGYDRELPRSGELKFTYHRVRGQPTEQHILSEEELDNVITFLTTKAHHSLSCVNQFMTMPETYFLSAHQADRVWRAVGEKFGFTSDATFAGLECMYHRTVGLNHFDDTPRVWETHIEAVDAGAVLRAQMGWTYHFVGANPTNHYLIELDHPPQRQVLRRLMEISSDMTRVAHEAGHWSRDQHEHEAGFRNCKLNHAPGFVYGPEQKIPSNGILEFDFVLSEPMTSACVPMRAADFESFWSFMISKEHLREAKLDELNKQTTLSYFTSFQMAKLLVMCSEQALRIAILIKMFHRVIDRRGFAKVLKTLPQAVVSAAHHRLSYFNCLDPVDPCGEYSLDLSLLDERRLCELLVKMTQSGGGYWQDIEIDGKAAKNIPGPWLSGEVPETSTVKFTFNRAVPKANFPVEGEDTPDPFGLSLSCCFLVDVWSPLACLSSLSCGATVETNVVLNPTTRCPRRD